MKNFILTLCAISCFGISSVFANEYVTTNYAPAEQPNEYQTQYPLPVNNYQAQGYQSNNLQNYYNTAQNLQGNVVMVPASTVFNACLMSPLSSQYSKVGDNISMYLNNDFYYGNTLIAGAGSRLNGTVVKARKGGFAGKNGNLELRFSNIITPTGQVIPLSARVQTDDETGVLRVATAKDTVGQYAKNAGIGAASGAVLGTAMGALSSGKVGKGAIYGTAVGGGIGLVSALFDKGENVEIPKNAQLNIILDQPITLSSNSPF